MDWRTARSILPVTSRNSRDAALAVLLAYREFAIVGQTVQAKGKFGQRDHQRHGRQHEAGGENDVGQGAG